MRKLENKKIVAVSQSTFKAKKKRRFLNICFAGLLFLAIAFYIDNFTFRVTAYHFSDAKIPKAFDKVKIIQISDLHNQSYGKDNQNLLKKIDEIAPDYIFLTGDLVSAKDRDFTNFYTLAKAIGEKYDCYYILGNHEMDLPNNLRKEIYDTLVANSITVLDNDMVYLTRENEVVPLYGMWYNPKYYIHEDFTVERMEQLLGAKKDGFTILLTHNPDDFDSVYAPWGADLTFAGHVHGGMIRLPLVGGLISPNRKFFPQYDSGMYEERGKHMIVSKGLSSGKSGFRLFNQPELVVVTLHCKR